MKEYLTNVSPKGQITIPAEVRRLLGIQPRDKVTIAVEDGTVKLRRGDTSLQSYYQLVPALPQRLSVEEMAELAAEEYAEQAVQEGRGRDGGSGHERDRPLPHEG